MDGDADIAALAEVLANRGRARMLLALTDGRALAASVLADEAGVAASTASEGLGALVGAGLLSVERHGRHRYYRLAGPQTAQLIETLAANAPRAKVKSLREGTRARAVREARTCYDHLAGRLGTALMASLIRRGALSGGEGTLTPGDRLSAPGSALDYRLTESGAELMNEIGIDVAALLTARRPLVRYCIDWSEQRHHLAGGLGAALCTRLLELGWVKRRPASRALTLTPEGADGLERTFGLSPPATLAG